MDRGSGAALRLAFATAALALVARSASAADRGVWMPAARWGVMTHYLADWREQVDDQRTTADSWNAMIDGFDVEGLAEQIASVGAGYHLLTIGQNSGYYLAPNATYDRLVGATTSKCARRDLVADMQAALAKRGVKLLVYLPAGPPGRDRAAQRALGFEGDGRRNHHFQQHWEAIIRDWSTRWGDRVHGWWFDGCYWPNLTYRYPDAPNFESFAAAARAGNPNAVVAFNPGVVDRILSVTPHEDYSAGEINFPDRLMIRRAIDGKVDGARIHVLSFLGETWGRGKPRFNDDQVAEYTQTVVKAGGVFTWDVPVGRSGLIALEFMDQLKHLAHLPKR
jgi:hypothetical protein